MEIAPESLFKLQDKIEEKSQYYSFSQASEIQQVEPDKLWPKYEDSFKQLLVGLLPKKTMNVIWQQRYFCLTPFRLLYYSDQTKNDLKGCFNLGSLQQHHLRINCYFPVITLTIIEQQGKEKELIKLLIENRQLFMKWFNEISQTIRHLTNNIQSQKQYKNKNITKISQLFPKLTNQCLNCSSNHFWNKILISTRQFKHYANHLDIILFRSKNQLSGMHRFFMGSYYDHVGLIIRDQSDKLYILEATQSRGVWVTDWQQIETGIKQNYQSIGYRKLIFPFMSSNKMSSEYINFEQLEEYLNKVMGKKYQLTLSKLYSSQKTSKSKIQTKKEVSGSYFCSQLIADIYLKFGFIINRQKNDFWPKDFEKQLKLQKGAILGPLLQIQF